jgi:hypothetical protein
VVDWTPVAPLAKEQHYSGWVDGLARKTMDDVLKTGWTPQRAAQIFGGMSESQMRTVVAYARRRGFLT